eukprot:CAMPEP_0179163424 /NCGR_PEP_ID=MMETSP0796-20121207/80129_1 /TAXON_ID=73915 /ORGANISM="Pyrodinium bahamense, Strain pbaha01" /LENGTH=246 /DNA_ID=CAMNT_0020865747 /DNA_START=36 /DNA_END=776 /DNA_ORIENTATION=+
MAAGTNADHYSILGIPQHSSAEEVKKAYRALSKVYHPDKAAHLGEAARRERERQMVALNVAYQVLMSPRQRQEYDSLARAGQAEPRRAASHERPPVVPRQAPGQPPRPSKPRYQVGGKYSASSRQARRMDPSQYTTHVDGRAAEFAGMAAPAQRVPSPSGFASGAVGGACRSAAPAPGAPRNPAWLQRQLDIAQEWEQAHCPPANEERYEWKKACDGFLRNLKERRQNRDQLERDDDIPPPVPLVA